MSYRSELIQVAAVAIAMVQDFDTDSTELNEQDNIGYEKMEQIIDDVREERYAQEAKWGAQHHSHGWWISILGEEFGEVCRANLEGDF